MSDPRKEPRRSGLKRDAGGASVRRRGEETSIRAKRPLRAIVPRQSALLQAAQTAAGETLSKRLHFRRHVGEAADPIGRIAAFENPHGVIRLRALLSCTAPSDFSHAKPCRRICAASTFCGASPVACACAGEPGMEAAASRAGDRTTGRYRRAFMRRPHLQTVQPIRTMTLSGPKDNRVPYEPGAAGLRLCVVKAPG